MSELDKTQWHWNEERGQWIVVEGGELWYWDDERQDWIKDDDG